METTRSSVVLLFVLLFVTEFIISNAYSNVSCIKSERQALLKFKSSLTDLSNQLSSWVGEDCCTWRGVGCNQKTGQVIMLNLRNPYSSYMIDQYDPNGFVRSCLGGAINPSLFELEYLSYLDLSFNNFRGIQIPKFIGSLSKLRHLNLASAGFEGMVPHQLGNLSNLRYLDLGRNDISPFQQNLTTDNLNWVSHLSSLRYLDLSLMYIKETSNWLYSINMLPHLLVLYLDYCGLGNISPLPHVNFTSLAILDLKLNKFNSTIPYWLFNLSNLEYLDLRYDAFRGSIPDAIGNLTSLTNLYLSGNSFEGEILRTLTNLCNLQNLHLGTNKFSGEVSVVLDSLFGCTGDTLESLELSENEFHGQIPSSLGQLSKLEYLEIYDNSFEGTISGLHFAKLERLTTLDMSKNSLVLNVSSTWVPPFQLKYLSMESCKLGPQFPPWLQTQMNVSDLYLSNTSILDTIPDWFQDVSMFIHNLDLSHNQIRGKILNCLKLGCCSVMEVLNLSENLFSGHIPQNISKIVPELSNLYLSDNHLTDSIPMSLCKMENLRVLDLSGNSLSGQLPQCWNNSMSLFWIDLAYNTLSGHIPSSMGSLHSLSYLSLSNNKFYGELPFSLKKCTSFVILDLSENKFSGKISSWIGESFSQLQFLILRSNMFDGNISPELCNLAHLQLLDVSQNNLTGTIPHCFGNFSAMQFHAKIRGVYYAGEHMLVGTKGRKLDYTGPPLFYLTSLDLSSNNMIGGIPEELTNLNGLLSLNISRNHFTGRIPEKISNLSLLESLDFSNNLFSGPIPQSMSTLTFLSHLNLSFNNLSGPIPIGNQLQTLDDPSIYIGNPLLCGRPLQKNCTRDSLTPVPFGGNKNKDENDMLWFYAGLAPGFACGFLAFYGVLVFKRTWRSTYFGLLENIISNRILS